MKIVYENTTNEFEISSMHGLSCPIHFHSSIELAYILSGECIAFADNRESRLGAGDLFISFPNQTHYYHDLTHLNAILFKLPQAFFEDYAPVMNKMSPACARVPAEKCTKALRLIIEQLYINACNDTPYRSTVIKGYAIALMGEILQNLTLEDDKSGNDVLLNILDYCNNNYKNGELTLQSVSDDLHISKYYISHIFSDKIRMSFNDYINSLRIDEACRLLEANDGRPVSEIAYDAGFGSIRTFNRAFLKFREKSPRSFKGEAF